MGSQDDLGGSSKYSNENFEDRSGEGFHVNSSRTWVSRSAWQQQGYIAATPHAAGPLYQWRLISLDRSTTERGRIFLYGRPG